VATALVEGNPAEMTGYSRCVNCDEATQERSKVGVKFHQLSIREYQVNVDDNPAVTKGPAIALSWEYREQEPVSVEQYEENKGPRADMKELQLTLKERIQLARASGATEKEIMRMTKRATISRNKRRRTLENQENFKTQEALERFFRTKRKIGLRRGYEDEEDKLWDNAQKIPYVRA
jgi:predicted aminopeptidase